VHSRIKRHVGAACPQRFIDVDFVIAAGLIRMRRRPIRARAARCQRSDDAGSGWSTQDASALHRASQGIENQGRLKIVTRGLPRDDGH
jgi:hypothetical protein